MKITHFSILFEHGKIAPKMYILLCEHEQDLQKTVLARLYVLFTFHRVWCLLNCGLYPQNPQLLSKQTLLAFNVLSLVLLKENAWALGYGCSLNGSMNKNLKSEEKIALCKPKKWPKIRLWDEILQRCGIKSWSISNSHQKLAKLMFTCTEHDVH